MRPLIVANWKMNPRTAQEAQELFLAVARETERIEGVELVICPPFVSIPQLRAQGFKLKIGAQNCFWEEAGPFTGEVSPSMLKDLGCTHVILGHSERETNLGETPHIVNKKIKAALRSGLVPVVCIGEQEKEHDDRWRHVVVRLRQVLEGLGKNDAERLVLVYEPVWAISTSEGVAAAPRDMEEAALLFRGILKEMGASAVQVLYGGSVTSQNVRSFLGEGKAQGVLVGGASLDAQEFGRLVKNAVLQ